MSVFPVVPRTQEHETGDRLIDSTFDPIRVDLYNTLHEVLSLERHMVTCLNIPLIFSVPVDQLHTIIFEGPVSQLPE